MPIDEPAGGGTVGLPALSAGDTAEWLRVTLSSIGDGVITTDRQGRVTFLNPVAQSLTGWTQEEAVAGGGVSIERVFKIVNEATRAKVDNPALRALREGIIVGLANHTLLIAKNGTEIPIDDSAAPIRNAEGDTAGAVLVFRDVTEHKRQEQRVKDALDYASNILDTQREPFLVIDKSLRVVSANRAFYRVFRVEKDATEGRFVYDLGDGQWNIPRLRELLEDVLPKDLAFEGFEVVHDFPAGVGRKTMLLNVRKIVRLGNHSELILLAIEDVTERKRSEDGLRESEIRYRTLFDLGPAAVYSCDASGVIQNFNRRAAELWGREPALGDTDERFCGSFRLFRPDGSRMPHEQCPMAEVVNGAALETRDAEVIIERPDGTRVTAVVNIRPLLNEHGEVTGAINCFYDVTERQRLETGLRESEVRYRRLFETAKDGVLILDATTGKITDANAFMCGLTGMESSEILGKELHEIGMFKDVDENKEAFRELQRTGYLRHDHLPVQNRRGEKVEVEFIANVYHEGDRLVAQCNVRDISDRVRLEKQVAKQAAALAAQSRGKDEFLAMLSHELRNPLAPIRSAVHLLRLQEAAGGRGGNPIQQQAREIIERQVANLTKMVSDLSEVSRVVSGRIRLDLQSVDLKQVVRHALQTVAPMFEQRKHSVSVNLCSEPLWAQVDPTRLEEVLVNLLNNAAKYTPDGGRIEVRCERHLHGGMDAESPHALMRVRDNGVGIDPELLPRIFDLFTQADRSLARSAGGLGIGLSLAQRLVALHGGAIWAHSQGAGKGSEFTIRLPLILEPDALPVATEKPPRAETVKPGVAGDGSPVRVLVVDDNVDLVTMLCGSLRHKGFDVQSAYTGPDGLRMAQQWRPDIALLDIGLPGLDGYEIARRLRSDPVLGMGVEGKGGVGGAAGAAVRMKLIAITGYGREDDIGLAREAGFDGHLVKPCDINELEKMMATPGLSM